ncbi:acetate--CoA ligase family protein [Corynebacterium variabile]|uniref:acetate--CoA ligase family protein n=1 Tax=Corynebacterium variabile TaxID=1727 RepID=UPI0028B0CF7C|nr:acetate--CoA ligase family protein [Corynebacterium variabile]
MQASVAEPSAVVPDGAVRHRLLSGEEVWIGEPGAGREPEVFDRDLLELFAVAAKVALARGRRWSVVATGVRVAIGSGTPEERRDALRSLGVGTKEQVRLIAVAGPEAGRIRVVEELRERVGAAVFTAPVGQVTAVLVVSGSDLDRLLVTAGNHLGISAVTVAEDSPHAWQQAMSALRFSQPATRTARDHSVEEAVREPEVFKRAALKALEKGKAVVVLKAGSSALAARTAAAHTGALVGDDSTVDAMFRDLGVIRVTSIEDMMVTAGVAAHTGPLEPGGFGAASISGGACDIIADRAEDADLPLAEITEDTHAALTEIMPAYGTIQNPLDLTGASVIDVSMFTNSVKILDKDPNVNAIGVISGLPWRGEGHYLGQRMIDAVGQAVTDGIDTPLIFVNQVLQPIYGYGDEILTKAGVPFASGGLVNVVNALADVNRWSERRREYLAEQEGVVAVNTMPAIVTVPEKKGTWSEEVSRDLLASVGVPVVTGVTVTDADEAVRVAADTGGPVAMKIVSPDIAHKSDIGGVKLNVEGEDAVREAYAAIDAAGRSVKDARISGVLVSPMRTDGLELLVGAVRDPDWGATLAIALGGVFVETFKDSVLTQLPVTPERVKKLISTLKSYPLLTGARGTVPADLDQLAGVVSRIGDLVLSLGDQLEALEVNPLRVNGDQVEALDALITWRDDVTDGSAA